MLNKYYKNKEYIINSFMIIEIFFKILKNVYKKKNIFLIIGF